MFLRCEQALDMQQHAWKREYMHADQSQHVPLLKSIRIHCKSVVLVCTGGVSSRDVPFGPDEGAALQRPYFNRKVCIWRAQALHRLPCSLAYVYSSQSVAVLQRYKKSP